MAQDGIGTLVPGRAGDASVTRGIRVGSWVASGARQHLASARTVHYGENVPRGTRDDGNEEKKEVTLEQRDAVIFYHHRSRQHVGD